MNHKKVIVERYKDAKQYEEDAIEKMEQGYVIHAVTAKRHVRGLFSMSIFGRKPMDFFVTYLWEDVGE